MDIRFYLTIVIALLNIFLGLFILRKNYKAPGNIYYCGLCISGGIWAIFMAFLYLVNSNQLLEICLKGTYAFAILPPLFYLMFAYHYPYKGWNYPEWLLKLIFTITVIMEVVFLSGLLNLQEAFIQNGVLQQIVHFKYFLVFSIYFFGYILWGLVILIIKIIRDSGFYISRISYLIGATISTFIIVGIISVILPLFDNWSYDAYGPFFTLLHFTIVGYLLFYKVNKN